MIEPLTRFQLAEFSALLAQPARAGMLLALLDGAARRAGELAVLAGVAPSTISAHLRKLVDAGLLSVLAQGRHRYYRLAGEEIADLLETLALARPRRTIRAPSTALERDFARARTCYHHLAGRLGVAFFERLRSQRGLVLTSDSVRLSKRGHRMLADSGLLADDDAIERLSGRSCLDWTERRFHLAGPLGTYLTHRLFDAGWLRRRRDTRALGITQRGHGGLAMLGLNWEQLPQRS